MVSIDDKEISPYQFMIFNDQKYEYSIKSAGVVFSVSKSGVSAWESVPLEVI